MAKYDYGWKKKRRNRNIKTTVSHSRCSFLRFIYIYLPTPQPFLNSVLSTQFNEEVKIHLALLTSLPFSSGIATTTPLTVIEFVHTNLKTPFVSHASLVQNVLSLHWGRLIWNWSPTFRKAVLAFNLRNGRNSKWKKQNIGFKKS